MIAYTLYSSDPRVRREAESIASLPDYKVQVLTLKETEFNRNYFLKDVEVRELNIAKYQGKSNIRYIMSYFSFLIRAFVACNKLLMRNSLDIIHVHNMPNFLVFAGIIPYLFGKKIILDVHDTIVETYSAKFDGLSHKILIPAFRLEEAICCKIAHKIICVNHIQRSELIKRNIPERKTVISMNVPDPEIFNINLRTDDIGGNSNKFRLVYHGTVTKRLSIDLALLAVSRLVERIPELEFYILGDGDDKSEFLKLSMDLGIQESVIYRNRVPIEDLIPILNEMDIGIIPNRKNIATDLMLPVKMLECVGLGIPVVVPKLKTIQYYFSDDMVFYYEPGDVESLTEVILDAYRNESKRRKKAQNAKRFLIKYGWETHKFDLINLYRTLK
ncbi:MAG: glycosyltransferase [Candidatus Dadabacteria bacterium]|nr:glycosyltransferase [Candidatus Dadabacteria bacterium]